MSRRENKELAKTNLKNMGRTCKKKKGETAVYGYRETRRGDEGLGDIKYGTRGRCGTGTQDVKYRDAGMSNTGTQGTLMIIAKVRVKCDISFFVKMCYLLSTLDSIVQNHIGHLMMFTQNISLYRSKCTDYRD